MLGVMKRHRPATPAKPKHETTATNEANIANTADEDEVLAIGDITITIDRAGRAWLNLAPSGYGWLIPEYNGTSELMIYIGNGKCNNGYVFDDIADNIFHRNAKTIWLT
jgi:hypothetical protein